MSIKYVNANILDAPEPVIVHGCNNKGVWGTGVAKALADKWPKTFNLFQYAHMSGALGLGSVVWGPRDPLEQRWVASVITQHAYGKDPNIRYASYDAIDRGMRTVVREGRERGLITDEYDALAIPQIGCGNGHADWGIVVAILKAIARDERVKFQVYVPDKAVFEFLNPDKRMRDESVSDRPGTP